MKSDIVKILSSINGNFELGGTKITPDGKYMVAVDAIRSQESGMNDITSLSITHDDKYLISRDSSGVINISRAINGEYIRTCGYMKEKEINDLAVSLSGVFITVCYNSFTSSNVRFDPIVRHNYKKKLLKY